MSKHKNKQRAELLMPGAAGWELWAGPEGGPLVREQTFTAGGGAFSSAAARRVLALPAAWTWILPAWLSARGEHVLPMAGLHLEKLGVRPAAGNHALDVSAIGETADASLARIIALRGHHASLSNLSHLPDECAPSARRWGFPRTASFFGGNSGGWWRRSPAGRGSFIAPNYVRRNLTKMPWRKFWPSACSSRSNV